MRPMMLALLLLVTAAPAAAQITDLERQRLLAHLEMTSRWLLDEVSTLSQTQLDFRRAPNSWTIMEVFEHLVVVGPIYWEDLRRAVQAPSTGRPSSNRDADILWYGIDRTNRETAVVPERPTGKLRDLKAALERYRKEHDRLVQYVRMTQDDLRNRIVDRQGSDAYQWALLISTHEQRHILQILEIKADPSFPRR